MKYEYTGELAIDLPTVGLRNIKKGDIFESNVEINNSFIKKVIDTPIVPIIPAPVEDKIAEEIKAEEAKIEELKSEEIKGVD
jgi:hypothetical protein